MPVELSCWTNFWCPVIRGLNGTVLLRESDLPEDWWSRKPLEDLESIWR